MLIALLLLQTAPAPTAAPDIQFQARVQAERVTIVKRGEASLTVRADPDAGSVVDVRAPAAYGRKTIRNVDLTIGAEARIGDPRAPISARVEGEETSSPQ